MMKKGCLIIFFLLLTFIPALVFAGWQDPIHSGDFVTTWQTNTVGATEPTKVILRFLKPATDTYYVSWDCDGNYEKFFTSLATHDYGTAGVHDVCIQSTGSLRFYAPDLADDEKAKLLEIKQWGNIKWYSFMSAFKGIV